MEEGKQIPTYRVLDGAGNVIEGAELPEVRSIHPAVVVTVYIEWKQIDEALARKM